MSTSRSDLAGATRDRIIRVAELLLAEGGREALSTRAVSTAADVQPATVYRIFGDKQGLLDTVAIHGYLGYLERSADVEAGPDPVDDIRRGWDLHVEYGLANPHTYSLIYGQPQPGIRSRAVLAASDVIRRLMQRLEDAGRLRTSVDGAVALANALGSGTVLTLIAMPEHERRMELSNLAREAMIVAVTTGPPGPEEATVVGSAVALRAGLSEVPALTTRELDLMREWLDRIADAHSD